MILIYTIDVLDQLGHGLWHLMVSGQYRALNLIVNWKPKYISMIS